MVAEAHGEVKLALQELRDLARGIHPAVLTDRGLDTALSAVASRCTVPVKVTVDLAERPAAAIESIAYFTVSELLQNISKHSGAKSAAVDVWRAENRLLIQVWDDGRGGARLDGGSGMRAPGRAAGRGPGGSWWTRRRPICGGSSGICTTGRRHGWWRLRWIWGLRGRSWRRMRRWRRGWWTRRTVR